MSDHSGPRRASKPHFGTTANNGQIQCDAAAGFSKGVVRRIARLVKKPMAPTLKLQLEDGSRITDERQATERWLRFASERHDGQPTSATALLETIAQTRPIFAATVRQEWVCPSLPDVVHLSGRVQTGRAWGEDLLPPDSPFPTGGWTVISPALCQGHHGH